MIVRRVNTYLLETQMKIFTGQIHCLGFTSKYSCPLVSIEDWFQDPNGYQNPPMLESLSQISISLDMATNKDKESTDKEGQCNPGVRIWKLVGKQMTRVDNY